MDDVYTSKKWLKRNNWATIISIIFILGLVVMALFGLSMTIAEGKTTQETSKDEEGLPLFEFGLILFFGLLLLFIIPKVDSELKSRKKAEERRKAEAKKRREDKKIEKVIKKYEERRKEQVRKSQEEERRKAEAKKRMEAKGYVEYKGKWGTPEQVRKWKEVDVGLDNNFANLTPTQFEKFVGELFRKMGYKVDVTPGSGDYGADIVAKKGDETIIVEVKKYSEGNLVTPKEVRGTLGAMWKFKADKAVFITTSDFTVRAKEVEKESPIELWNKKILHQMVRKYFIEN